jgi:hypothetical protein
MSGLSISAHPELVEGLSFLFPSRRKAGKGFDKLSPNGIWEPPER